jgi:predicted membrane-bound spermidine synthase
MNIPHETTKRVYGIKGVVMHIQKSPINTYMGISFCTGLVIMVYEMIGTRIMSPFVGNSMTVWAFAISAIMLSLSVGNYIGGKFSENYGDFNKVLSIIMLFAGIIITVNGVLHVPILLLLSRIFKNIHLSALCSTVYLYAVPNLLLGMVSPVITKIIIMENTNGRTIGKLYAVQALGNIIGTLLGGIILIQFFDTVTIVYLIGLLLFIITFIIKRKKRRLVVLMIFCVIGFIIVNNFYNNNQNGYKYETAYNTIFIFDTVEDDNRTVRYLMTEPYSAMSKMYTDSPNELVNGHYNECINSFINYDTVRDILVLGGGAYSYPKYVYTEYPDINIDVVEIDSALTVISEKHFGLNKDKVVIINEDARRYINNSKKKYDVIIVDVYITHYIPFHIITRESFANMVTLLNHNGIVCININGRLDSEYVYDIYKTVKTVFKYAELFQEKNNVKDDERQNIILVVGNNVIADSGYKKIIPYKNNAIVYTDTFAPIEKYMLYDK